MLRSSLRVNLETKAKKQRRRQVADAGAALIHCDLGALQRVVVRVVVVTVLVCITLLRAEVRLTRGIGGQ
jgi:hypothetical protein